MEAQSSLPPGIHPAYTQPSRSSESLSPSLTGSLFGHYTWIVSQVETTQSQFTFNDSRRSHSVLMHITVSDTCEYMLKVYCSTVETFGKTNHYIFLMLLLAS